MEPQNNFLLAGYKNYKSRDRYFIFCFSFDQFSAGKLRKKRFPILRDLETLNLKNDL